MNNPTKILSFVFIFAVFGSGLLIPNLAVADHSTAHTIEQLQSQVKQLLLQIKALQQQQISEPSTKPNFVPAEPVSKPTPPATPTCPIFSYNLIRGVNDKDTGGEVTKLQKILATDPNVYPEGLITGYFGKFTEKALQRWQTKQGIVSSGGPTTTGYGVVGRQTRAKMITACPAPLPIPSNSIITVLSPNGGETWTKGTTQTIKWQDDTPMPSCPIDLGVSCIQGSSAKYYDIQLVSYYPPCAAGLLCPALYAAAPYIVVKNVGGTSYSWSVGKYLEVLGTGAGGVAPDGSYTIQICQTNSTTCDSSDSYFKITTGSTVNR